MNILKNRKYIGVYSFAGQEKDGIISPIVDKNIFDQAHARIDKNRMKPASKKAREEYLLTHKAFCRYCHQSLVADSGTSNKGVVYRYYKCGAKKKSASPCCLKQFNKNILENIIVKAIDEALTDEFIFWAARQVIEKNKQINENIKLTEYEKELAQVNKELENIVNAIAQGAFNNTMQAKMLELESRKADIEHNIAEQKLSIPIPLEYDEVVFWFTQFQNGDLTDDVFRTRLIDTFLNKAVVSNDKIYLTFNVRQNGKDDLTVAEIIADFENEESKKNPYNKGFDLYHVGAVERT